MYAARTNDDQQPAEGVGTTYDARCRPAGRRDSLGRYGRYGEVVAEECGRDEGVVLGNISTSTKEGRVKNVGAGKEGLTPVTLLSSNGRFLSGEGVAVLIFPSVSVVICLDAE